MGPLKGIRIVELAGIGPGPMAGMLLADWGADVIRIERSNKRPATHKYDVSHRGKKSIVLDLKQDEGKEILFELLKTSDAIIEGYRPGVTEKLGIGPDDCMKINPGLVYGRMTGWGQEGPLNQCSGHDINYIALTGALHSVGTKNEKPCVPLNLFGDMGGGGMLLVAGLLAAILESKASGEGQVVDAAMVDGAAQLMWMFHSFHANGRWNPEERESNLLDGGAHFYDTYETLDGKYIALGAIEPQFYALLVELAGLDKDYFSPESQLNKERWPEFKSKLAEIFKLKTRDQWSELLEGTDACFSPVLTMLEAPEHPHNKARNTYIELDGVTQPAPAPRFSRTQAVPRHGQHEAGEDTQLVLSELGISPKKIEQLRDKAVIC